MATRELSNQDFKRLVGLLIRSDFFRNRHERKAFLSAALGEYEEGRRLLDSLEPDLETPAAVADSILRDLEFESPGGTPAISQIAAEILRRITPDSPDRAFLMSLAGKSPRNPQNRAQRSKPAPPFPRSQVDDLFASPHVSRARVFISYSHTTPHHARRVSTIAESLKTVCDVSWDQEREHDGRAPWNWSWDEYAKADYVIMIATREWSRRFVESKSENAERYDTGRGVIYEANLINKDIWYGRTRRLLVVLLDESHRSELPDPLQGLARFLWPGDQQKLLSLISSISRAAASPGPVAEDRSTDSLLPADWQLCDPSQPSRLPIVIAIEDSAKTLEYDMLLGMERHLTVTLTSDQVRVLEQAPETLSAVGCTFEQIVEVGRRVWRVLEESEPRLSGLLTKVKPHGILQPVAWTGLPELLVRIYRAILLAVATLGQGSASLAFNCGAHFFSPITRARFGPSTNARSPKKPGAPSISIKQFAFPDDNAGASDIVSVARIQDVAILSTRSLSSKLVVAVEALETPQECPSYVRMISAFGDGPVSAEVLDRLLAQVPCLTVGGPALRDERLLSAWQRSISSAGSSQAVQCIQSAVRQKWIQVARERNEIPALLDGLFWTTWSSIGMPLFAAGFSQLPPPAYPHLTDLRSIASTGWYHERRQGVRECYRAASLVRRDGKPEDHFHLYLTGAGGTGKSFFLRSVYEKLLERDDVLAVWHRIDAPSSEWKDVEKRLKEECSLALKAKFSPDPVPFQPRDSLSLSSYLIDLVRAARESGWDPFEVVIFLDQLERTFESGDEPEFERLNRIAAAFKELLADVGVGRHIRVFVASRKQYLPDFLHSWQDAAMSGLHFNVLQVITDGGDQRDFVSDVQKWCRDEKLVDDSVRVDPDAALELAKNVSGHPLNMMLAIIQLLSEHRTGRVTIEVIQKLRPWEKLFAFDERIMAKSDLEWYILLAMAHARTEIVRFEEVWWRLRLVNAELTKQVNKLQKRQVIERLWLLGHLGRTIHVRGDDADPTKFLEFFHANLRDYLLRDVMGYGGIDVRFSGRPGGTPAAWRSLDRLASAAREWKQTQQLLAADDVRALMEHRAVVVELTGTTGHPADDIFSLLFLRDSRDLRPALCQAAKECFVLSSLVHDDFGRWAFQAVFPDVDVRIECCQRWLETSGYEGRMRILQYLISLDLDSARKYLVGMVLDQAAGSAIGWRDVARQLSEPLYAARYRTPFAATLVEVIGEIRLRNAEFQKRLQDFMSAACEGDRNQIANLFASCSSLLNSSPRLEANRLAPLLLSMDCCPEEGGPQTTEPAQSATANRMALSTPAKVQLVPGTGLLEFVSYARIEGWRRSLSEDFGIPLPPIEPAGGEVDPDQIELRLNGRRLADLTIHPGRSQILKRHWDYRHDFTAQDGHLLFHDTLKEHVIWLEESYLARIGWNGTQLSPDQAALSWLGDQLRIHSDELIDLDVVSDFLKEVEAAIDVSRLFLQFSIYDLLRVMRSLVRERVPFGTPAARRLMMQVLADMPEDSAPDIIIAKLREHYRWELCKVHIARSRGRLFGITLTQELEEILREDLGPAAMQSLGAALKRIVERNLWENDALPIVVCAPHLRSGLSSIIQQFDARLAVLGSTEIPAEVPYSTIVRLPADAVSGASSELAAYG